MKIAYIATSDSGGAGHATLRLHQGMLRNGISCDLLLRERSSSAPRLHVVQTRADVDEHLAFSRDAALWHHVHRNRTDFSNSHFSLHVDGVDLSKHPIVRSSDLAHLHWTSGLQTPKDVEALLRKKPVVWTLHDLEPLTGGCHYRSGCDGYTKGCDSCPQLSRDPFQLTGATLSEKLARWSGHALTLIVPSMYMADHVRRSTMGALEGLEVVHIPHGIDLQTFRPRSKAAARRLLGIPAEGLYVVAGSLNTAEQRKGLHRLGEISVAIRRRLPESVKLRFLIVGEPGLNRDKFPDVDVIQVGKLPVEKMPHLFAASDLYLHTSYEDNSPLMLLEAMACGKPAIAFSSGGAAELIVEDHCGHVVDLGAEHAIAEAASSVLADSSKLQAMSTNARHRAEQQYSEALSLTRHVAVYETILSRPRHPKVPRLPADEMATRLSSFVSTAIVARVDDFQNRIKQLEESLEDQVSQVLEKQHEVDKVHDIAANREGLIQRLHDGRAEDAQAAQDIIERQRHEIELLLGIAAERLRTIGLIEEAAVQRKQLLQELNAQRLAEIHSSEQMLKEQQGEIRLAHAVAAERLRLVHVVEELATKRQEEIQDLDAERLRDARSSERTIVEQQREIELIHEVAAERLRTIEVLNREVQRLRRVKGNLTAMLEERQTDVSANASFQLPALPRSPSPNSPLKSD